MRKIVRVSLGIVVTSLLVAVGCGDDDDSSPGGDGGSSSGGASTGGSTVKGGAGGATTGGASTGGRASGGGNTSGGKSAGGAGGAGGATDTTECEAIGELCHPVDDVNGPLHSCHELGHTGDAAICHERFGACVTACVGAGEEGEGGASAGGATSVGGAGGGGASGDGQSPYCLALGELCHPVASISAALEECHEIGHIGDAPVCEMRFSDCASACLAAREAGEGGGNGGAGGMGAGGMSAGGGGAGGAR